MERKLGQGHASAMWRLGLRELREALNPSKESVAREELGLFGTLTPGEIAQQREGTQYQPVLEQEQTSRLAQLHSLTTQPPTRPPTEQELTR